MGCFRLLTLVVSITAVNTEMQIAAGVPDLSSVGDVPRNEIAGPYDTYDTDNKPLLLLEELPSCFL